ncbi:hypothetical protein FGO68_gene15279 [Halteria grandinella]|uniref:Uncharacterized protein n=1 Tax=Halteria grandinella TaxID=5974 RepID=A0A8J8P2R7_HALGN|nr:hypothetical protein FGO68_gene15279 [Halteria grandinella]
MRPETLTPQSKRRNMPVEKSMEGSFAPTPPSYRAKKPSTESDDNSPKYQNFTKLVKQSQQQEKNQAEYQGCPIVIRDSSPDDLDQFATYNVPHSKQDSTNGRFAYPRESSLNRDQNRLVTDSNYLNDMKNPSKRYSPVVLYQHRNHRETSKLKQIHVSQNSWLNKSLNSSSRNSPNGASRPRTSSLYNEENKSANNGRENSNLKDSYDPDELPNSCDLANSKEDGGAGIVVKVVQKEIMGSYCPSQSQFQNNKASLNQDSKTQNNSSQEASQLNSPLQGSLAANDIRPLSALDKILLNAFQIQSFARKQSNQNNPNRFTFNQMSVASDSVANPEFSVGHVQNNLLQFLQQRQSGMSGLNNNDFSNNLGQQFPNNLKHGVVSRSSSANHHQFLKITKKNTTLGQKRTGREWAWHRWRIPQLLGALRGRR